ncbi:hypothetical protein LOZ12_002221 [Ophidiomyces ophidiicola]|nr:hypothetical protein LOZ45_001116 [Ophidiomyces ophidiicola]KAI2055965.1 hypothetical protein LOZ44_002056 [Ophidiomyces ophidiicola]KAI2071371.1 hypothetical protein LOZ40_001756 [Ophidiomyces ophidiicola]KAI2121963.1 hypothetical protein LOZ42_000814 [Ophidiomyces ophidiicola]KAI2127901.1 hypothetical protein LOZ31_002315 [Ophidiomyces ophidiicola]
MFYDGDLQSGIALAVRETKQVICFVRDDGEESAKWENEYLADKEISLLVSSTSIALRLSAGSQEAGFLASFCPVNKVPTLVIIKNGVLQEYIISGTAEGEFKSRVKAVLSLSSPPTPKQPTQTPQTLQQDSTPLNNIQEAVPDPDPEEDTAAEVARRESIKQGKKPATSPTAASLPNNPTKTTQKSWRDQQLSREAQERKERERVLALIRQDKKERKIKDEQNKVTLQTTSQTSDPHTESSKPKLKSSEYRLQVRLFDGSSIRSCFSPTQTLNRDVRAWIDSHRTDGNTPYNFKQILTPLPNKTISISEEGQNLSDIGLGPSANLVMVPVHNYTDAYATSESSLPVRGLYAGYNLVTSAVGAVAGTLTTFLGLGGSQTTPQQGENGGPGVGHPVAAADTSENTSRDTRPSRANKVRTLYDHQSDDGDRQFYNGNQVCSLKMISANARNVYADHRALQLNFEPRKDAGKED